MVHTGTMILNMSSEIGHMLVDESYCPSGVTQKDILGFFDTLITEFESSYQLKDSDLDKMNSDINSYFDDCTSEKNSLVAEEASEAAAEIVAGAAMVASAACSWMPGVNFALSATALAAEATALALEVESQKLKKTIVEDISNADGHLREKSSFSNVKTYVDAQTSNTMFYPRLQLGMTILETRAVFLASVVTSKKELKRNITSDDLKAQFVGWYNASQADPTLVDQFSTIYDELEANPEDFSEFNEKVNTLIITYMAPQYRTIGVSLLLNLVATLTIRKGIVYYKSWKNANSLAKEFNSDVGDLDSDGAVAESAAEAGEMDMLTVASACTMAISFLAGIASLVFGVLEAVEAANTDKVLTKAISDAKSAITEYYKKIVNHSM